MDNTTPDISQRLRITTPDYCNLVGLEDLIAAVEAEGIEVENHKVHLPAFCSGFEFVADLFLHANYAQIFADGIIFNLATILLKKILSPLISFFKKNRHVDFDPITRIRLNDILLILHGPLELMEEAEILKYLTDTIKAIGISNIAEVTKIELLTPQSANSELLIGINDITTPELVILYTNGTTCRHPLPTFP